MGAWIETRLRGILLTVICVAPYVGAWIETILICRQLHQKRSHPTWVRGLKLRRLERPKTPRLSHPTWVRGLKQFVLALQKYVNVAPYVGAWIETTSPPGGKDFVLVAPYVGAWIETRK